MVLIIFGFFEIVIVDDVGNCFGLFNIYEYSIIVSIVG